MNGYKIYIIGPVGSGKTTLANYLSKEDFSYKISLKENFKWLKKDFKNKEKKCLRIKENAKDIKVLSKKELDNFMYHK